MQEDQLHEELTIREAMEFAYKLKYSTLSLNSHNRKMVNILTLYCCKFMYLNVLLCKILD